MTTPTPSILILGPGKSGTSALYYAVKQAAERHYARTFDGYFEPKDVPAMTGFAAPFTIAKMLQERLPLQQMQATDGYEKRIYILRDPRDNIISRLTWWCWSLLPPGDLSAREAVLKMLALKEADPAALSVVAMLDRIAQISGRPDCAKGARNISVRAAAALAANANLFPLHYEDFAANRLEALSAYLGFQVANEPDMPSIHSHLRRTGGSGDWKNWFTPGDLDYFVAPLAKDYLAMGYDPDETVGADQVISPDFATGFVQSQFARIDGATI